MEVTGTIDEVTVGDLFPVGEPFKITIDYETPTTTDLIDSEEAFYLQIPVNSRLEFESDIFLMSNMFVTLDLLPDPSSGKFSTNFGVNTPFGDILMPPFRSNNLGIDIESDSPIFDDASRLPSSLDQWSLNSGNSEVTFLFEEGDGVGGELERWAFQSSSLSLISLSPIPEPSSAVMLSFGLVGLLRRKR